MKLVVGDKVKILNFCSCNIDHVYSVLHITNPGETIASDILREFPGGKGLNQSIAIARSGEKVYVVLCDEVEQILSKNPKRIVIGGQNKIKQAMAVLLKNVSFAKIEIIDDEQAEQAANNGIIKIYEYSNNER